VSLTKADLAILQSPCEVDRKAVFDILGYEPFPGRVLKKRAPSLYVLEYFGIIIEFSLSAAVGLRSPHARKR